MGRSPCCAKEGLNRGAWTAMEDKTLTDYIKLHGEGRWRSLPKRAGLKRCGKSCRLRWLNYLRPDIKRGNITADEEELIIRLHRLLGNRWSLIAGRLPGRTDNEIKNYWNTNLSKKLQDHQLHRQSNAKQFDKKRVMKSSTATRHVQPQSSSPNVAIRTKAVKCTRVVINPPPPIPLPPPPPPPDTPAPPTCNTQIVDPESDNDAINSNLVLLEGLLEGPLLEDFPAMDFNVMGELNFSEFLNSPHMLDTCGEFSQGTSNEEEQFSPTLSLEEPIVFPEEMMEDWRRSGCGLDASAVEYLLGE